MCFWETKQKKKIFLKSKNGELNLNWPLEIGFHDQLSLQFFSDDPPQDVAWGLGSFGALKLWDSATRSSALALVVRENVHKAAARLRAQLVGAGQPEPWRKWCPGG